MTLLEILKLSFQVTYDHISNQIHNYFDVYIYIIARSSIALTFRFDVVVDVRVVWVLPPNNI